MGLFWKRIVILTFLFGAIFGIYFYERSRHSDYAESIRYLTVNRKQKADYDALFDDANFKSVTVIFTETGFQELLGKMQDHMDLYGDYQDNTMHKVSIRYSDGLGNDFTVNEVGFRTRSNTSRNLPMTIDYLDRKIYHQTSFQLQFDATFDYADNSNAYQILNGREVFDVDQLNFEYQKLFESEYDQAMITEDYAYSLYQEAGVITANSSYGLVYFQIGSLVVPFGLYTIIETIDNEFLKKHFDGNIIGDYGDLYKATDIDIPATLGTDCLDSIGIDDESQAVHYSFTLKNNTLDGTRQIFDPLENLIESLNNPDLAKETLSGLVDVDGFLRFLAMDFLIGNTDEYRYNANNYYLYFQVYDHQAVLIPFDLDNVLGFGKHKDLSGDHGVYYPLFAATDSEAVLVEKVLAFPEYRELYLGYIEEFNQELFAFSAFEAAFQNAKNLYETILQSENHLGNQVFDLRNSEWYFTAKHDNVESLLMQP